MHPMIRRLAAASLCLTIGAASAADAQYIRQMSFPAPNTGSPTADAFIGNAQCVANCGLARGNCLMGALRGRDTSLWASTQCIGQMMACVANCDRLLDNALRSIDDPRLLVPERP